MRFLLQATAHMPLIPKVMIIITFYEFLYLFTYTITITIVPALSSLYSEPRTDVLSEEDF